MLSLSRKKAVPVLAVHWGCTNVVIITVIHPLPGHSITPYIVLCNFWKLLKLVLLSSTSSPRKAMVVHSIQNCQRLMPLFYQSLPKYRPHRATSFNNHNLAPHRDLQELETI